MTKARGDKIRTCIQGIVATLDEILPKAGFTRSPDDVAEGKRFITWTQVADWRKNVVQLVYPIEQLDYLPYIEVLFRVRLLQESRETIFAGVNVRDVVKKVRSSYCFRPLFGLLNCRKVIREIGTDVRRALGWFTPYATLEGCLAKLQTGETSLGPIEDGSASSRAHAFLIGLMR